MYLINKWNFIIEKLTNLSKTTQLIKGKVQVAGFRIGFSSR